MIQLRPIGSEQHCIIVSNEPAIIEAHLVAGRLMVEVYRLSEEEEIVGAFDGTLETNTFWKSEVGDE
jgi:hypothetical protein